MTAYLFHKPYNGISEPKLSASHFVDSFVAVGRFFHLPNWIFKFAELCAERLQEGKPEVWKSLATVDRFVSQLVDEAKKEDNAAGETYQARLMKAGISREETIAQCKDLIFAGTDSTGMNLSMICWYLVQQPEKYKYTSFSLDNCAYITRYKRLREEIEGKPNSSATRSFKQWPSCPRSSFSTSRNRHWSLSVYSSFQSQCLHQSPRFPS